MRSAILSLKQEADLNVTFSVQATSVRRLHWLGEPRELKRWSNVSNHPRWTF